MNLTWALPLSAHPSASAAQDVCSTHLLSLGSPLGRPGSGSPQVRHRPQLHTGGGVELSASADTTGAWRAGKLTFSRIDCAGLEGLPEARCRLALWHPVSAGHAAGGLLRLRSDPERQCA